MNTASGAVNYLSWISTAINALLAADGSAFLPVASQWIVIFATVTFFIIGGRIALKMGSPREIAPFAIKFVVGSLLLLNYASFAGLFNANAEYLTSFLDTRLLGNVLKKLSDVVLTMEHPSLMDISESITYLLILLNVALVDMIFFMLNAVPMIYVGILTLIGPLAIPALMFDATARFFWNWFSSILTYSFFKVFAAAFVYVMARFYIEFVDLSVHNDFTLSQMLILVPMMYAFGGAFLIGAMHMHKLVSDCFAGAGHAASSTSSAALVAVARMF